MDKPYLYIFYIIFVILMSLVLLSSFAFAGDVDFFSYRLNFPPNESREHKVDIINNYNQTVTVNVSVPAGFTALGGSCSYPSSGLFSCLLTPNQTKYLTVKSPDNCSEGSVYWSNVESSLGDSFNIMYVCLPDNKITDCKVEYGHGDANYLDELYISNETATIFNLVRVWNIGHYLTPDEDALDVHINCSYENYPVRTYGRVELEHTPYSVEGAFDWNTIQGGYWFRIGVVSQEVSGKIEDEYYNVSCTDLTYKFENYMVVANSTTCDLEIRSQEPFDFTLTSHPSDPTKSVLTITNDEKYTVYDVSFDKLLDSVTHTESYEVLEPGESVSYVVDSGTACDSKVFFIPSWYINSWTPKHYSQILDCSQLNHPPLLDPIGNITAYVNQSMVFDVNATDIDNDTLIFSDNTSLFDIDNSTGIFNFTPGDGDIGNYSVEICVTDQSNVTDCEVINVEVLPLSNFSLSAPELYLELLDDDSTVGLNWTDVGADHYNIYFSDDPENFLSSPNITGVTDVRFNDTTANTTKFRYYMVEAVKGSLKNESVNIGCKYDVFVPNATGIPGEVEGYYFGFPCNPINRSINNVIRNPTDQDRIYYYNYTLSPPRYETTRYFSVISDWFGDFSEFDLDYGYWFSPHSGNKNITLVGLVPEGQYSYYLPNSTGIPGEIEGYILDWNHYKTVCNVSEVVRNPTDGDRIYRYNWTLSPPRYETTRYFSVISDWFGDFECFEPGFSYWFSPSTNLTFEYMRLVR